jgi:hypothetical protein
MKACANPLCSDRCVLRPARSQRRIQCLCTGRRTDLAASSRETCLASQWSRPAGSARLAACGESCKQVPAHDCEVRSLDSRNITTTKGLESRSFRGGDPRLRSWCRGSFPMAGFACMPSMRWAGAKAGSSRLKRWIRASASMDRLAKCSDLWTRYECPAANLVMMGFGRRTPILESGFAASLVHPHCIRPQWPGTLLPFGCSFRQLSPLERRHGQLRCEYLGCSRAGQADRIPTLHPGNLHGIPCASPS